MESHSETTPLTGGKSSVNKQSTSAKSHYKYLPVVGFGILAIIALLVIGINIFNPNISHSHSNINPIPNTNEKITTEIESETTQQPHIIWFIADDLGYSDISLHGSEIATPNIDSIAANGIELKSHYVMPLCSPTRASLLSGRHAFRLGLQTTMTDIIKPQAIPHVPSQYKLAGQYFKESGYETRAYGKWHLGYAKKSYTPLQRGFDHHTGFYQFAISYFTKETLDQQVGYDWYDDEKINWDVSAEDLYTTFILSDKISKDITEYAESESSDPLFMYIAFQNPHFVVGVPDDFESNCDLIEDLDRKLYCSHVQALDFAVGQVLESLKANGLYENSVIAFATDNGALSMNLCGNPGEHAAAGSAYPYRGGKYTLFEGGVRTPAFLSGNYIPQEFHGKSTNKKFQAVDWIPTLLHFTNNGPESFLFDYDKFDGEIESETDIEAGIETEVNSESRLIKYPPDGSDMYDALFDDATSIHEERDYIILNIDWNDLFGGFVDSSIIYHNWKMIVNHELILIGNSCDVRSAKPFSVPFTSMVNPLANDFNFNNLMLFNLEDDEFEYIDLLDGLGEKSPNYEKYQVIINEMFDVLSKEKDNGFMSLQDPTLISEGDSSNFDGAWVSFQDETDDEFDVPESAKMNKRFGMMEPLQPLQPMQPMQFAK